MLRGWGLSDAQLPSQIKMTWWRSDLGPSHLKFEK